MSKVTLDELAAWEGSTAASAALWEWRGRRLLAEVRRLQARVTELERERLARFGRSVTVSNAEIRPDDDPWTGVVGFFKD